MSTDTPMTGDWWCPSCKVALDGTRVTYDERCDTCGTPVSVAGEGDIVRLERENARLREEVEMLNVRHAAAMLHAQTHADEYNALREELAALQTENKWWAGIVNDCGQATFDEVKRLTKELAEAKRERDLANERLAKSCDEGRGDYEYPVCSRAIDAENRAEQAETRALANEKDAAVAKFGATCFAEHRDEMSDLDGGWLHEKALECGLIYGKEVTAEMWDGCGSVHCECEVGDICYFPTDAGKAAISGAKHEG